MPEEKKNFPQKIKEIAIIVGFILLLGSNLITWSDARTKNALLEDQLNRNTEQLKKYSLEIISYRLNDMDEKLDDILDLLNE